MNEKITQDDAIGLAEVVADKIGERLNRSFTESEEAHLAVAIFGWCRFMQITEEVSICKCQGFYRPPDCPVHGGTPR